MSVLIDGIPMPKDCRDCCFKYESDASDRLAYCYISGCWIIPKDSERAGVCLLKEIQPEPQWIPCSERMPEEREWIGTKRFGTTISDEVYVTFENPKGERFCKHISFQNGKLSNFDQRKIDAFFKNAVPIAWMPLPEPYNGGEHDGSD